MHLTPRETHVLIIIILIFFALILAQLTLPARILYNLNHSQPAQLIPLLCIVFPLGIYIATDPHRRK